MEGSGCIRPLQRNEDRESAPNNLVRKLHRGAGNGGWLLLGYGRIFRTAPITDAFHFDDPHHRLKRFASLFSPEAALTNPVAFLERLHLKGARYQKPRSLNFLRVLNRELSPWLEVEPEAWLSKNHEFRPWWEELFRNENANSEPIPLDEAKRLAVRNAADGFRGALGIAPVRTTKLVKVSVSTSSGRVEKIKLQKIQLEPIRVSREIFKSAART